MRSKSFQIVVVVATLSTHISLGDAPTQSVSPTTDKTLPQEVLTNVPSYELKEVLDAESGTHFTILFDNTTKKFVRLDQSRGKSLGGKNVELKKLDAKEGTAEIAIDGETITVENLSKKKRKIVLGDGFASARSEAYTNIELPHNLELHEKLLETAKNAESDVTEPEKAQK